MSSRDSHGSGSADPAERRNDGECGGSGPVRSSYRDLRESSPDGRCCRELHERLILRNEQIKHVHLPEVYIEHENAKKNVSTWMNSAVIEDAVPNILSVRPIPDVLVSSDQPFRSQANALPISLGRITPIVDSSILLVVDYRLDDPPLDLKRRLLLLHQTMPHVLSHPLGVELLLHTLHPNDGSLATSNHLVLVHLDLLHLKP